MGLDGDFQRVDGAYARTSEKIECFLQISASIQNGLKWNEAVSGRKKTAEDVFTTPGMHRCIYEQI